ncbi:PucR family transcriptional regulator [Alicyclobacillus cellulosilyticus]|uniref:PucR family transcriptional regulator n=1 Tax=Alicyclobacillus cellulosilyticus TaxID=1003997 RepID=UPI0016674C7A|nr:PucR family transcriptional regulator [Alicyclobacillus cellulosilyticus]
MQVRVSDLLTLPMFDEARVVAGHAGTVRPVSTVNMMDAPDIVEYLKAEELLITTAYALKDDVRALESLVEQMAVIGCAGLGIKTKRFLDHIPQSVIDVAERYQLPLIELPLRYSLGEMLHQALTYILEKRMEELRYSLQAHQQFSQIILQGKGMKELMESLAAVIGQPVALFDVHGDLIAASRTTQGQRAQEILQKVSSTIPRLSGDDSAVSLTALLGPRQGAEVTLFPVHPGQRFGYLAVMAPQLSFDALAKLAIEQAGNVVSFEMMKLQAVRERTRRYKNEFFSELLDRRIQSEAEIFHRGRPYGVQSSDLYQCAVSKVDAKTKPLMATSGEASPLQMERDVLYEHLRRELRKTGVPHSLFYKHQYVVVLFYHKHHLAKDGVDVYDICRRMQESIQLHGALSVSFGIGNPVSKLADIPKSYDEAVQALEAGIRERRSGFVNVYRTKDTVELLRLIPRRELEEYRDAALGAWLALPEEEREVLLSTLSAFLDCQGNIAETAKTLYLHRNTVLYRLHKLSQIVGVNLKDPATTLRLRLALLIHHRILSPAQESIPRV